MNLNKKCKCGLCLSVCSLKMGVLSRNNKRPVESSLNSVKTKTFTTSMRLIVHFCLLSYVSSVVCGTGRRGRLPQTIVCLSFLRILQDFVLTFRFGRVRLSPVLQLTCLPLTVVVDMVPCFWLRHGLEIRIVPTDELFRQICCWSHRTAPVCGRFSAAFSVYKGFYLTFFLTFNF